VDGMRIRTRNVQHFVLGHHAESQVRLPLLAQREVEYGMKVSARKSKYGGRLSLLYNVWLRKECGLNESSLQERHVLHDLSI
jgi:hypothetical protein